jgi:hypothetical protein
MSDPIRRGGRFAGDAGRTVTWSVADGSRGRRWRWIVVDRRGTLLIAHTLETDAEGHFMRLESSTAAGLLTLHREPDASIHGNRISERGIDHLAVEAPAPAAILIGATDLSVAILAASTDLPMGQVAIDVLEVLDDLGVRIATATIRFEGDGTWQVRTNRQARRARLGADGLPAGDEDSSNWPLERE